MYVREVFPIKQETLHGLQAKDIPRKLTGVQVTEGQANRTQVHPNTLDIVP